MKWVFVLALFTSWLGVIGAVIYELTDEEYYKMPPILSLDPYDRCLRQPGAFYCSAFFVYVADQHSPLLQQMQEYSKQTVSHFNHTRAFLGTCVSTNCKHLLNNSSDLELTLEACLNETVYEKYMLKVRLDDELFCISKDDRNNSNKIVIEPVDIAVGIIFMVLVVLNIVGSFFDVNYSEESNNRVVPRILLSFSLSRNWKSLTTSFNNIQDPRTKRLKSIHGIRTILMNLVIMAHSLIPITLLGKNPEYTEATYSSLTANSIRNGRLIMQTFFVISAFLSIYNLQISDEKKTVTWKRLCVVFIKRLFRLTRPYALILALVATWYRYFGTGPFWQKLVLIESNSCRKHWWRNLLYINNCIEGSNCMRQTWYLATDVQLYAVGLIVFLLGRNLKVRMILLGGLLLLDLVMPALYTYFQDLNGGFLITPTSVMNSFVTDATQTNMSGSVIGLSLGYLVYHLQKIDFNAGKYKKWRPIFWSLVPLVIVIVMSNAVFYKSSRVSIVYRVLGAALSKPLFAACTAALLLGFIFKLECVYRSVVEWGGWKPLSRVSYSAYLLHSVIIRTWTGHYTDAIDISCLKMIEVAISMIVLAWLSAIVFWLTVEAPLEHVTKMLLEPSKSDKKNP